MTTITRVCVALAGFAMTHATGRTSAPTGEEVVRLMREKGSAHAYRALTFVQKTSYPDRPQETWYESMQNPGLLRIDVAPVGSRTLLFRNDSLYQFRNGTLARASAYVHPLMVLLTDVYALPAERTIARIKALGFDLARTHETTYQGRPVYVVGAAPGDTVSPQFWVDTQQFTMLRLVQKSGAGGTSRAETIVTKHEQIGKALVETSMYFTVDGKEMQREDYTEVTVNPTLDPAIFDPAKNLIPSWISARKP